MLEKRASPVAIVDLTVDSDDEEQEARLGDVRKRRHSDNHRKNKKRTKTDCTDNVPVEYDDVIVIDPPPQEDRKRAAISETAAAAEDESHDCVQIVTAPTPGVSPVATLRENVDEELQVVGTKNEYRLPHNRCSCTVHKFVSHSSNREDYRVINEKHCDLCYCYVCDILVKDCKSWSCDADGTWYENHCNATDDQNYWVQKRRQAKLQARRSEAEPAATSTPNQRLQNHADVRSTALGAPQDAAHQGFFSRSGPFKPGPLPDFAIPSDYSACVKCGWSSAISAMRGLRCLKCGRRSIKSRDIDKGVPYKKRSTDHYLGTRKIKFRIIASDVRLMNQYRSTWEEADMNDPKWKYNDKRMRADYFKYMIGTNPTAESFLATVSEWDEQKLRESNGEGVVLDNPNDIPLLRLLADEYFATCHDLDPFARLYLQRNEEARLFRGDLKCTWKKGCGTLRIRLYIPLECIDKTNVNDKYAFLLGYWFGILPFNLADLCGTLKASRHTGNQTGIPKDLEKAFIGAAEKHNKNVAERLSSLSLTSSCCKTYIGGVTDTINTLEGILKKCFKEASSHVVLDCSVSTKEFDFDFDYDFDHLDCSEMETEDFGKISTHRSRSQEAESLYCLLNHRDRLVAGLCLQKSAKRAFCANVLSDLENLGHEPEETCEGLSIELLPFQKQTLRWALERETVPGGIQSLFWAKVPGVELYFNPILGRFRNDKPREVRGGIIAEEMGLGKTVISLALILKHPAPQLPISGSSSASLSETVPASNEETSKWDKDLYCSASTSNPRRGSILSRGTLVICPVSLVGQWMEEAKSKLDDPGLLYPYHGSNRIRDAGTLARNAIVVTTYQVLASDDTYHRVRSSDPSSYCPPLEQVRWWRIICDEGHSLRQASTKRNKSISNLVADHKWLVTGTPVNTALFDLRNQLKFIGIENVDEVFRIFGARCTLEDLRANRNKNKLMFFLRSVIMRHTQKQSYRGTKTTLMSLPSKTESSTEVTLSPVERKEYDALDNTAKAFYLDFKRSHSNDLSSHYLKLSQKLTPMRVACSGGHIPLDEGGDAAHEDADMDEDRPVAAQKKSAVKYSDFAFTAKFNVLIEELKRAKDIDPTSKSLVFSQYSSTLEWLKNELPKHGFQYRTLSGSMSMKQRAKSLHDFQSDPPTTIFLLSMRAGNCGINLTQANRVFLMEPGFNPALEQQAIGRVHRLGQKREVEIVRLLVKDSVETRLRKFLEKKYPKHLLSSAGNSSEGSGKEDDDGTIGPLGNVSSERPRSEIMADEFDILFGVRPNDTASSGNAQSSHQNGGANIPDSAVSSGFI